ncbi:hypothetical protein HZC09_01435 [Candidatus Micrarchaeota archaeon]|nr:hypothetical protein [Candidatus Micrarchaeota archaeon]
MEVPGGFRVYQHQDGKVVTRPKYYSFFNRSWKQEHLEADTKKTLAILGDRANPFRALIFSRLEHEPKPRFFVLPFNKLQFFVKRVRKGTAETLGSDYENELRVAAMWHKKHPQHAFEPIGSFFVRGDKFLVYKYYTNFVQCAEYLQTLASAVRIKGEDWCAERRLKLAKLLGDAVGKAHKLFGHGDLHPQNISVALDGKDFPVNVILRDFELSREGVKWRGYGKSKFVAGPAKNLASDLKRLFYKSQTLGTLRFALPRPEEQLAFLEEYDKHTGRNLASALKTLWERKRKKKTP